MTDALKDARQLVAQTQGDPSARRIALARFVELVLRRHEWREFSEAERCAAELVERTATDCGPMSLELAEANLLLGHTRLAWTSTRQDAVAPLAAAVSIFERVRGSDAETTGKAYERLGFALWRAERWGEAADALQHALPMLRGTAIPDAALLSWVFFRLGMSLERAGRPDAALLALGQVASGIPSGPAQASVAVERGRALLSAGRLEEAAEAARDLAQTPTSYAAALALESRRLTALGDRSKALAFHDVACVYGANWGWPGGGLALPAADSDPCVVAHIVAAVVRYRRVRERLDFVVGTATRADLVLVVPSSWAERSVLSDLVARALSQLNTATGRGANDYGSGWDEDPSVAVDFEFHILSEAEVRAGSWKQPEATLLGIWRAERSGVRPILERELPGRTGS